MRTRDLRAWIEDVRRLGLVKDVKGADWNLEIGAITDINSKGKKSTLLFDEIKGYPAGFRVLTGVTLDAKRMALALGMPVPQNDIEFVRNLRTRMETADKKVADFAPRTVRSAPFMKNVRKGDDIDLTAFPVPKWFEGDGGRYMGTADAVITKDRTSDWINVGTYRVMVHDKRTPGIFIEGPRHGRGHVQEYFRHGEPCPVVVSFGHNPALFIFAGMEVPQNVSEFDYVGAVTGSPYEVVKGPVTGLPIPADSEIVIEGHIVNEIRPEGPFGEFIGYYQHGTTQSPIIKVEAVYFRDDPILLGTCSGRPPHDYSYFRCPMRAGMIWNILDRSGVPDVKGVWCHEAGYSRAFTVVSIKQAYAGHDRQAGHIASQCRPGAIAGRYVVVVDDDIDPADLNDVIWAMSSRSDPATGIDIIKESLGTPLDPLAELDEGKDVREYSSSRGIIFATKPYKKLVHNEFLKVVEPSEELKKSVREGWPQAF